MSTSIVPLQPRASEGYLPNLPGNALYLAIYSLLLLVQVFQLWRYRTWGYSFGTIVGLLCEVLGYVGRIKMHFLKPAFLQYILCVTIAPAFLSAAIYLCLARVVVVAGEHVSRLRPRTYTITFMICDLVALLLQAAGGALASSEDMDTANMGIRVMMAGLSAHVISLALFIALCSDFAWRVRMHRHELDARFSALRSTWLFKFGLISLGAATLAIFIRTCFRVAELSGGFSGPLIQNEVSYMILEGAMIVVASTLLTIGHPGIAFQGSWDSADFKVGRGKQNVERGSKSRRSYGWRVGSQEIPLATV